VRAFDNPEVVHVDDSIDPIRDMNTIMYELCKKDIQYVEKERAKREQEVKKDPKMKLPPVFFTVMVRTKLVLFVHLFFVLFICLIYVSAFFSVSFMNVQLFAIFLSLL
jgi:hypothetical protein